MQTSHLRLDQYHLDELHFSLDEKYEYKGMDKEPRLSAEDLDIEVRPFRNPENRLEWYFQLGVRLDDKEGKFPYVFSIRLTGFFEVSEDCKPDMTTSLALINAPSILYASAREILATVSARSRYLSIFLPSVRFFGSPPAKAVESSTSRALAEGSAASKPAKAKKPIARKK